MDALFQNRREAGKLMVEKLKSYRGKNNVIVLALPRGGVPVASEIAKSLQAPLDLMPVRKLGLPGQEELAIGAIALSGICAFNEDVIRISGISQNDIEQIASAELKELQRRNRLYRNGAAPPNLQGKIVILVDDGAATGVDMCTALIAVASQHPLLTIAVLPIASEEALSMLQPIADDVLCLHVPSLFFAVGQAYDDFSQTTDEEVAWLLKDAQEVHPY